MPRSHLLAKENADLKLTDQIIAHDGDAPWIGSKQWIQSPMETAELTTQWVAELIRYASKSPATWSNAWSSELRELQDFQDPSKYLNEPTKVTCQQADLWASQFSAALLQLLDIQLLWLGQWDHVGEGETPQYRGSTLGSLPLVMWGRLQDSWLDATRKLVDHMITVYAKS